MLIMDETSWTYSIHFSSIHECVYIYGLVFAGVYPAISCEIPRHNLPVLLSQEAPFSYKFIIHPLRPALHGARLSTRLRWPRCTGPRGVSRIAQPRARRQLGRPRGLARTRETGREARDLPATRTKRTIFKIFQVFSGH